MLTEDYVSYETAKLLKEKGFDEKCYCHYSSDGRTQHWNYQSPIDGISAPSLQMTMKWLRNTYNVHVVPKYDFYGGFYTGRIYDGRRETAMERNDYIALTGYSKYEEAAEAAIKYCLKNLI